ncbi:MAG TPA: hypothetical protein VMD97_09015 [Candidatus Aquilonibacter sp.]|nr:hypothetical protein [Candidatus Aquilonibacter sp.]
MRSLINSKTFLALVAVVTTLFIQPSVKAQKPDDSVVATIPFGFQVGSYHLAAGKYTLEVQGDNVLWVKGDSDSAPVMILRDTARRPSSDSAVVFYRYGNHYFLREIRTAGQQERLEATESKAERRAKLEEEAVNRNPRPGPDAKVEIALLSSPR